jgi:Putative carbonic anhydrase
MSKVAREMEEKELEESRKDFPFESRELLEKVPYALGYDRPLIVRCYDSRLNPIFDAFLKEHAWSHKDVISLPGGARALASEDPADAAAKQAILDAIKTGISVHDAKWILLTIHFDCRGYRTAFSSDEAEQEREKRDLAEAVRFVSENVSPEFLVEGRFVDGHGIHPV